MSAHYVFRRNCISTEPCDYLRPGCASDADCKTGLTCGLVGIVPTCLDLDECAQDPGICGSDTCINLISTYRYVKISRVTIKSLEKEYNI